METMRGRRVIKDSVNIPSRDLHTKSMDNVGCFG